METPPRAWGRLDYPLNQFFSGGNTPRAWGRLNKESAGRKERRNTPTGVGKTDSIPSLWRPPWKHPHGRGEDISPGWGSQIKAETPPRAWGRPGRQEPRAATWRNTPTGVGKTLNSMQTGWYPQKHPHGRGEDELTSLDGEQTVETPPRAWGRPRGRAVMAGQPGNTPTGVGKTPRRPVRLCLPAKHPHGRGEDCLPTVAARKYEETPPRAWGRLFLHAADVVVVRNTPTGVGKTAAPRRALRPPEKHPHGRGEDDKRSARPQTGKETPPRAWGRLLHGQRLWPPSGNTPTGVGKTSPARTARRWARKHPHGRGEDRLFFRNPGT